MNDDTLATIVGNAIERIERLSFEVGSNSLEHINMRDKLAAAEKECQELRDALKEAMQEVRERKSEQSDNQGSESPIDASLLHSILTKAGVPRASEPIVVRIQHLADFYSVIIRLKGATRNG